MATKKPETKAETNEEKKIEPWKIMNIEKEPIEMIVKKRLSEFEGTKRKHARLITTKDLLTSPDGYHSFMFQCGKNRNSVTSVIALGILELLEEMKEIKALLTPKEEKKGLTRK